MIKNIIKYTALVITIIITTCYILGLSAQWISPNSWTLPTYFVMLMPIWIILMFGCFLFWLCSRKWIYATSICLLMILTFSQWRNVIIINTPTTTESKSITILTFNTRLFNNQSKNGFDEITKFIKENNADIVCLQEFGHYYNFGKSKKDILNFFDSIYPYRHIWFKNQNTLGENGLATFSRYPIIEKKKIEYKSDDNISIYSDIVINSDTIRVINNHLESNKLNQEDRNLAQKIINKENSQDKIYNIGLNASSKFISSAQNRIQQVEAVRTIINNTKYPIIVLGDFNDVPLSYTYHTIAKGLQNAQAKAGEWGYHWTYNKNAMFFTIDHILIDKNIQITDCTIHKEIKASDHYPISCKIQL